jgi:hypothetical protein
MVTLDLEPPGLSGDGTKASGSAVAWPDAGRRAFRKNQEISGAAQGFQRIAGRVYALPSGVGEHAARGCRQPDDPEATDMKTSTITLITMLAFAAVPLLASAQSMDSQLTRVPPVASGRSAWDQSGRADSRTPARRIEGLWDEQVEQVDCRSGAPLHPIGRGTNLFIRGGSLVATNNAPPTVMGIALGQWRYIGDGDRFRATMRLNLFQPPLETFVGIRVIKRDITLSDHGSTLSGVVFTQDYSPENMRLGDPICARESGMRVSAP